MLRDVGVRAARRLILAVVSILLPALLLGYLGVRAIAERSNNLRTTYTATVALVRDRLTTELTHLESGMAIDLARLDGILDNPAASRAWLQELAAARPWLARPFLLHSDGGVMTGDLEADLVTPRGPFNPTAVESLFDSVITPSELWVLENFLPKPAVR